MGRPSGRSPRPPGSGVPAGLSPTPERRLPALSEGTGFVGAARAWQRTPYTSPCTSPLITPNGMKGEEPVRPRLQTAPIAPRYGSNHEIRTIDGAGIDSVSA